MAFNPVRGDASVLSERDFHAVTSADHFETPIGCVHFVHSRKNGQMLDVLDMRIGICVDVRGETTYDAFEQLFQQPAKEYFPYHFRTTCN